MDVDLIFPFCFGNWFETGMSFFWEKFNSKRKFIMRLRNMAFTAVLLAVFCMSCQKDEQGIDGGKGEGGRTVRFQSAIQGILTRVTDQAWEEGDRLGVYMCEASGSNLTANQQYVADVQGNLTVAGGTDLVYPESGKVKFYAYYPYQEEVSNDAYRVDVTGNKDLVWAVTEELEASENPVSLLFAHQLTKLELVVKAGTGVNSLEGLEVKANGLYGSADFNLKTGVLSNRTVGNEVEIGMQIAGNDRKGSFILIPCEQLAGASLSFTLNGASFVWDVSNLTFNAKTKYVYTITLSRPTGNEVEASFGAATIGEWTDRVEREETLTEDGGSVVPGVSWGQPELKTGTLQVGKSVAGTTIEVPYTGGEGVTLGSVTVEVSGEAAAGISVTGQTNVGLQASGKLNLVVNGTPTVAGNVAFTVKADGKTVGSTVAGQVAEAEGSGNEGQVLLEQDFAACTVGPAYPSSASAEFDVSSLGSGWTGVKVYSAMGMVKCGSGSAKGSVTTPALSGLTGTKNVRVTFDIAGWPNKNPQIVIVVEGGGTLSVDLIKGYKNDGSDGLESRTFDITGATSGTTIRLEGKNASNNQFFLDNIKVTEL